MSLQTQNGNQLRHVSAGFHTLETPDGQPIGFINQAGRGCYRTLFSACNPKGVDHDVGTYDTLEDAIAALEG